MGGRVSIPYAPLLLTSLTVREDGSVVPCEGLVQQRLGDIGVHGVLPGVRIVAKVEGELRLLWKGAGRGGGARGVSARKGQRRARQRIMRLALPDFGWVRMTWPVETVVQNCELLPFSVLDMGRHLTATLTQSAMLQHTKKLELREGKIRSHFGLSFA